MKDVNNRSRFKHHLQKQAYKNVLLVTLGIVGIITLLVIFGTNLLVGFSLMVGKFTGGDDAATTTQSQSYIAPPILDTPPEATSSASIVLSGTGEAAQRIELYRNGSLVGKTTAKSNNDFSFKNVRIEDGENTFKTRAVNDEGKKSEYSNEVVVALLNKPPDLTIDSPQEDKVYKKDQGPVKISGKTNSGVTVTVNDFRAIVDDEGNFSYLYTLKDGTNSLKVVATDTADNKTTKDINIRTE